MDAPTTIADCRWETEQDWMERAVEVESEHPESARKSAGIRSRRNPLEDLNDYLLEGLPEDAPDA